MDEPQPPQPPTPEEPWGDPAQQSSEGPWGAPQQWPGPETGGVEQPQSIRTAVRLMQVGAALSVLSILFTLVQRDEIRDMIEDENPSFTTDEVDTAVSVGITLSIVGALIAAGLWLWMANSNAKGKTWARTTATVLGGINVLFTLINLAGGQLTGLGAVFTVVSLALAVTILVLLYRPDSNRFYDMMSGRVGY